MSYSLAAALIFSSKLHPTYKGKLYIVVECCSVLAAASDYAICRFPYSAMGFIGLKKRLDRC